MLEVSSSSSSKSPPALGAEAVAEFSAKCMALGFCVEDQSDRLLPHDLVVNGLRVEVKTRTTDSTTFHLKGRRSCFLIAYKTQDVDVFAIRLNGLWHIFPSTVLADDTGNVKNKVTVKRISPYANDWGVLSHSSGTRIRQKSFLK